MQNIILECAVRSTLIALCTGSLLFILRVRAARLRHAVWSSVVVLMLALPLWTNWGPRAVVRVLASPTPPPNQYPIPQTFSPQALPNRVEMTSAPARHSAWTWQNILAAIYLAGFSTLLARLAIGTLRVRILVRRAVVCEGRLTSDSCAVPVTVGWLNPSVILPPCWIHWPQAQLNAVLTHESEHARRRDPLVQWLALLNRAIFWFHPLAWWLERRLSALSEEACDAAVLSLGHDPFAYSEYLMDMARAMRQSGARVNFVAMAMPGASLPRRIRRILEAAPAPGISRLRTVCVATACAVVSALCTAGAVDYSHPQTPAPPVASHPLQAVRDAAPSDSPSAAELALVYRSYKPLPRPHVLVAQAQSTSAHSSQSNTGSLSGTVEDPSGGRIVHCNVSVHDPSGSIATTYSDAAGVYRFASLAPGSYSLEFGAPGFALRTTHVIIESARPARLDAALELGQVMQTVEITASKRAAPASPVTPQAAPKPGPITIGGMVRAARLTRNPQPVYPPELWQQGIEGTVRVRAVISRDGTLVNPHVLNADEIDPRFAQAALDSLSQWRYEPATLNAHPVDTLTNIDVMFRLGN